MDPNPPNPKKRKFENITREELKECKIEAASIYRLVSYVWQPKSHVQLFGVEHLRKILCLEPSPIEEIISSEVLVRFVDFLYLNDNQELQFEAVSCFAIISSEHPHVIVDHGILPVLVKLVTSPNTKISEQAIYTLGNVAMSHSDWPDRSEAFHAVVTRLNDLPVQKEPYLLQVCTCTLAKFCKGAVLTTDQRAEALPALKKLLDEDDNAVVTLACWALCDMSNVQVGDLIDIRIYYQLANLLKVNFRKYTSSVLIPMLLTLLNILKEDETEFVNSLEIISESLSSILVNPEHYHKGPNKIIYNIISKLTVAQNRAIFIECMLEYGGIYDSISAYLDAVESMAMRKNAHIKEFEIKVNEIREGEDDESNEAALALAHLASNASVDQVRNLVDRGCIHQLCSLMSRQKNPRHCPRVDEACLDGIISMLKMLNAEAEDKLTPDIFNEDDVEIISDLATEETHSDCIIIQENIAKANDIYSLI